MYVIGMSGKGKSKLLDVNCQHIVSIRTASTS
jgi:hypothetical protein